MNIIINFNEVTGFVKKNYKKDIILKGIGEKTLEFYYKPHKLVPQISIRLNITSINRGCIQLTYDSCMGIPQLINGIVKVFQKTIPAGVEIDTDNKIVRVYLNKIKELEKVLEYIMLDDITFTDKTMTITLITV